MNKLAKILGIAAIGAMALQVPAQAETATRGAYAEVRPNGSSFAAAFETVLPDSAVTLIGTDGADPATISPAALTILVNAPGTNLSDLDSLTFTNVIYDTSTQQTIEAAIARAIDVASGVTSGTVTTTEEDITGYIRAFVGPEGIGAADASLD